ncbi:MAG: adenosylcobinamide amidohydrolase [Actinobacteria bacterium]|nr:adenosylcobinamide amidohydrolase [Actinomycetota bacterium]MBW3650335.1 adenosylcobinamide amidohydrolase [Actinomycetota bacterium]
MQLQLRSRREAGDDLPLLLWRFAAPVRGIASSPHGGGLGVRRWVVNAQVPPGYARRDPDHHLGKLAVSLGLPGRGVGMLTAADVRSYTSATDHGVEATATVGLGHAVLAAAPHDPRPVPMAGTINVVAILPERLSDAALVNAIATATEAKTQALRDLGLHATGTATDAVCLLCPNEGRPHDFGGPRSLWGARLARAVHAAVVASRR